MVKWGNEKRKMSTSENRSAAGDAPGWHKAYIAEDLSKSFTLQIARV
jgi:hypothetical protein